MNTIISFFQNGAEFMYPIALVLVVGLAIAVERFIFLTNAKVSNRRAFDRILPLLRKKDYGAVVDLARQSKAPVGRIVAAGIARLQQTPRRDEIEYAMEEGVMEAVPRLEKRTPYLATLANIATLLGLLGTIMGLIEAFTAVANADPAVKATLLSNSISLAMNTTAFGLIVAIPLLMLHAMLQSKTTEIVDSLEMAGVKCLNIMSAANAFAAKSRSTDAAK
ncbi:MotA/TolQ/ExbB proton channel family protein [Saccharophagus degradans]|uniref:MotA/TolQ/ExbB proton channel family protein n=1 Tax=Saccharophagus degradans TaxID=86304 RepID=A0AAW7X7S9_9GAMM|nr:MotA/TolQ/ExbB proton channel family protein [Saccharophagus degradans]MDO6423629.1 MotA/TolQ/ExbB proton channel family protein [Saccharophagus degradans]MDO6607699.1 MotA/TolQ/ExbB proton channel family protein [Saccharophagus degradans]